MSREKPSPFDDAVTNESEFDAVLQQLLRSATENDIDPRGAWEYRNGAGHPDFEVMITELLKREGSD